MKEIISYLIFLLVDLKVNFLLAKKLKINATPVETVLAGTFAMPSAVKPNKKPKSSAVLIAPTIANRPTCALFFMLRLVVFFDEITGAILGLAKNPRDIFADYAQADQLNTAQK